MNKKITKFITPMLVILTLAINIVSGADKFRSIRIKELKLAKVEIETTSTKSGTKDTMGAPCPEGGILLFGKAGDLSEWQIGRKKNKKIAWIVEDGVMTIKPKSGSIITKRNFSDFLLHLEFNVNKGGKGQKSGNSGVYIQLRYEVQILNSYGKEKLAYNECGGIYKYKAADVNACRPAGEWQTYDIDFRAARWNEAGEKTENARITVWQNNKKIHDNVEIPNKTGSGKPEGPTDGPILLQDHGNPVKFRNIWIVPKNK